MAKYNTEGLYQWAVRLYGSDPFPVINYKITIDGSSNIYLALTCNWYLTCVNANNSTTTSTGNYSNGRNTFLVKYNTNGICQWIAGIGAGGSGVITQPADSITGQ